MAKDESREKSIYLRWGFIPQKSGENCPILSAELYDRRTGLSRRNIFHGDRGKTRLQRPCFFPSVSPCTPLSFSFSLSVFFSTPPISPASPSHPCTFRQFYRGALPRVIAVLTGCLKKINLYRRRTFNPLALQLGALKPGLSGNRRKDCSRITIEPESVWDRGSKADDIRRDGR